MGLFRPTVHEHHHGPTSVTKTIHEHRAPTDESVKLLREMESKAEEQLRAAMPVEFNEFKGTVFMFQDMRSFGTKFGIKYVINGVEHEFMTKIPWDGFIKTDPQFLLDNIKKQFSEHLATTLLQGLSDQLLVQFNLAGLFRR